MSWCPNCKLEYVDGITVCPDCKSALVDSLEDAETGTLSNEEAYPEELVGSLPVSEEIDPEEIMAQVELLKKIQEAKIRSSYKPKADIYEDNKSGAAVLLACGIIGFLVLILNAVGVFHLPMTGFSQTLVYVVMGCLFFVFLIMGIRSFLVLKRIKPEVEAENELIEKLVEFIKVKKAEGVYLRPSDENYETDYMDICERAVTDINEEFPDLEEGFAFYVVDRFAGDILDED